MHGSRFLLAALLFGLCACGGDDAAAGGAGGAPAGKGSAAITAEMKAKLAAADKVDGNVDHVVHRCAGCALGMDGKAEFKLAVDDYSMHFCKQACLDRYQHDTVGELTKLKVQ